MPANPHNAWALPPTTTTSLRFVGETFEKLATAADGADAAPTPDARAGYAATTALLDKALKDWAMLTLTKLGALNAQLKAAHRDAISARGTGVEKGPPLVELLDFCVRAK